MVPFGGWEMPVQYQGILAEHRAVRQSAGLFDLSHMGRLYFRGASGRELLQLLSTNDVEALTPGRAQYGLLCNQQGGILDDTVAYNFGAELLLVVNASNRLKILQWIDQQAGGDCGAVHDATFETAMIGLQGPRAEEILAPLTDLEPGNLRYYAGQWGKVAGHEALVARTGYTGEDGFELIMAAERAAELWETLAARTEPVQPTLCGLGARDTLRLEAGMALYGHEITEATNPYEAGLGRVVKLQKERFVGRAALAELSAVPPSRQLVGFQMVDLAVPRQGYAVESGGTVVGEVTSGTFSPSLERNLGMAYVTRALAEPGNEIEIVVRGQGRRAVVVALPHYAHRTRRPARPNPTTQPNNPLRETGRSAR
jgi:glycine cleavage system T protein (aminomethyltransferase)